MKIAGNQTHSVTGSTLDQASKFTIKTSPKAFAILSNSLYTNKPRAVMRELCCNAYDSHIAASCADRPFEITMPTDESPTLEIRDFGTGMSEDDICHVYTTYFESTKTDSNDYVGQLGLGSKSPLSLCKMFTVESRKDGKQYVYAIYIADDGTPSYTKLSECATDEPNGVAIAVPISQEYRDGINIALQDVAPLFDPAPVVHASKVPYHDARFVYESLNGRWKIRASCNTYNFQGNQSMPCPSHSRALMFIQGNVAYPVPPNITFSKHSISATDETLIRRLLDMPINIYVNIGQLEVAPSREALSGDVNTLDKICMYLIDLLRDIKELRNAWFDAFPTPGIARNQLWANASTSWQYTSLAEVVCMLAGVDARAWYELHDGQQCFGWRGSHYPVHTMQINLSGDCGNTRCIVASRYGSDASIKFKSIVNTDDIPDTFLIDMCSPVFIVRCDVGSITDAKDAARAYMANLKRGQTVVFVRANKRGATIPPQRALDNVCKSLLDVPCINLSEWKWFKPSAKVPHRQQYRQQRVRKINFRDVVRGCNTYDIAVQMKDRDFAAGGIYVPVEDNRLINADMGVFGQCSLAAVSILSVAVKLGVFTEADFNTKIFGLTPSVVKRAQKSKKWINVYDYIAQYVVNNASAIVDAMQLCLPINSTAQSAWVDRLSPDLGVGNIIDKTYGQDTNDAASAIVQRCGDNTKFGYFIKKWFVGRRYIDSGVFNHIIAVIKACTDEKDAPSVCCNMPSGNYFRDDLAGVFDSYPMLKHVYMVEQSVAHLDPVIMDYINTVDTARHIVAY